MWVDLHRDILEEFAAHPQGIADHGGWSELAFSTAPRFRRRLYSVTRRPRRLPSERGGRRGNGDGRDISGRAAYMAEYRRRPTSMAKERARDAKRRTLPEYRAKRREYLRAWRLAKKTGKA